jgi:hypothetical protein
MPFSGSETDQGYCIFRYALFNHPTEEYFDVPSPEILHHAAGSTNKPIK